MQRRSTSPRHLDVTQPVRVRRATGKPAPPSIYPAAHRMPNHVPPAPVPMPHPARPGAQPLMPRRSRPANRLRWWMVLAVGVVGLMAGLCGLLTLSVGMVYAGGILPGVSAAGVDLGGLSEPEAAAKLQARWSGDSILLADGRREWPVNPVLLGITLDAQRTAHAAYQQGRGAGNPLQAILGSVPVVPVVNIDWAAMEAGLAELAPRLEAAPVNAGVQLINGHVEATLPVDGRMLNLAGTLARLRGDKTALANGRLELAMFSVQPEITDASAMVADAERLLSSFLDIRLYDPKTGDSVYWSISPNEWASWLVASSNPASPGGLSLALSDGPVRDYLNIQANITFDSTRYVQVEEGVTAIQEAVGEGRTTVTMRVYHHDIQHTVQPGETIVSIAWDYGVPYPWVQASNPGLDSLSVGQTITIPSVDNFLLYPVVPDKRIVVSISQQRTWVYENGQIKWDWPTSTGIASSPTWPGIYQIQSHEINAYAGNWNLWMPNFMGVYQPIPGSDFTNGFHGFPTRGGGQLLWENSLGTRVTYGCILLSNTNVQLLYNWAEEGVVVEIQP